MGINDYSASRLQGKVRNADRGWSNLQGAVNDVRALREMLLGRYGFRPEDVHLLLDQQATRQALLEGIERCLLAPSCPGDVALFYFSGHGSRVPNPRSDEPDGMDETLVPADAPLGVPDVRDKELRRRFNRILDRGARLTVVLDSCHSGSGARFPTGASCRGLKPSRIAVEDGSPTDPPAEDRGALVLAAAQDFEAAWETRDEGGTFHGAFSLALLRALRDVLPGEPAEQTFARSRARLQVERQFQEPVLAGKPEALRTPFLGGRAGSPQERTVVALERVREDGRVVLQGGWLQGLTVGSELGPLDPGVPEVRLAVTALQGLGRSEARIVTREGQGVPRALPAGSLWEIVRWAPPPDAPLRVWMPGAAGAFDAAVRLARELAARARRAGVRWVDDPTEPPPGRPLHLVRRRGPGWELLRPGDPVLPLGPAPEAAAILSRIPRGDSLFVQLPAAPALLQGIQVGRGTRRDGVEPTDRPEDADYVLAGRLAGDRLEYAWLRPEGSAADQEMTALPVRTAWHPGEGGEAAAELQRAVLRLRKIHAWHRLETPAGGEFAYELALRRVADGAVKREGRLVGKERYDLVLLRKGTAPAGTVKPRYVYVFAIDSQGKSTLLFPASGPVDNRFPLRQAPQLPLPDTLYELTEPYGIETCFLLTTDEPILNPSVIEWQEVRGPPGRTALEELLAATGGEARALIRTALPAKWSIEKKIFLSVPPRKGRLEK